MIRSTSALLTSLLLFPLAASAAGNSDAAKLCQKGGYENWRQEDGVTPFKNAGECTSYAAKGGKLTAPKPPATPVAECGTTITAPGRYELTTDLECGGAVGVTIQANNVEFSLGGHTIASWNASLFLGGNGPQSHITVQGPGLVTGSPNSAIVLVEVSYSTVKNLTVSGSRVGIAVIGSFDSVGNTVTGNTLTGNEDGMQVIGSADSEYSNNVASNNSSHGILIGGEAQYGQITRGNDVHDNTVTNNGGFGIQATQAGTDNTISNNTISGSGWADVVDNNDAGVNTWTGNTYATSWTPYLTK